MRLGACGLAAVLALGLAPRASARDGAIELNATRAAAGNVTPGDAAGYPITISESGSYVLTSNLTVGSLALGAIDVTASEVTIDLNGFTVSGTSSCSGYGPTLACGSPTGPSGITSSADGTVVRNGFVRGFGTNGVYLANGCRIEDVTATQSRAYGVRAGRGCVVSGVIGNRNGFAGIYVDYGSLAVQSSARGNGLQGILAQPGSSVQTCAAHGNDTDGIATSNYSTLHHNASAENGADGISAFDNSVLIGNAVWANTGFGLDLGTTTPYMHNTVQGNTAGTVQDGTTLGFNNCNGNTICP
jgi:hypothetical protein